MLDGSERRPTAVGAYVYAGGFSVGVERAGFDVVAHLEGDNAYGVSSARLNWPDRPIYYGPSKWPLDALRERSIDFSYANPPCAVFSAMGIRTTRGADGWRSDPRMEHWWDSFRVLEKVRPRAWCLESVTQAYSRGREVIDEMTKRALMGGYSVTHVLLCARWHGIPQARKRFFIVAHGPAMLRGYQPNYAPPPTVGELLETVAGDPGVHTRVNPSFVEALKLCAPGTGLSTAWERANPNFSENRNAQGKVRGRPSFQDQRLHAGETMGAFVGDKYYHPTEDRMLGHREMLALCGYPDDFALDGPERGWASLLARAVMPPVGAWLARAVAATLAEPDADWRSRRVTLIDVREPSRAAVDLTPQYLDDAGRVRLRVRADGSWSSAPPSHAETPVVRPAVVVPAAAFTVLGSDETALTTSSTASVATTRSVAGSSVARVDSPTPTTGEGSGKFMQRLWRDTDLSVEEILAAVHANYEGRTTGRSDVYYNYRKLIDAGVAVRPWPSPTRAVAARPMAKTVEVAQIARSAEPAKVSAAETVAKAPVVGGLAARSTIVPAYRGEVDRALLYFSTLADRSAPSPLSSARIAWFLQDELDFEVTYHQGSYPTDVVPARIRELWVVNSSWMWMKDEWRRISMRLFARADRIVFCQNDYALYINSYHVGSIRPDANYAFLTTCQGVPVHAKHEMNPALINWNALTYEPRRWDDDADRDNRPYYFGSFRTGRKKVFDRYFVEPPARMVVSASNGADERAFREAYPKLEVVSRTANVRAELERWGSTLLLEDDKASSIYVSPPNRFYEALSSGTAIVFDRASVPMWARYGYDVAPFAADGPRDVERIAARWKSVSDAQAEWHADHVGALRDRLHSILPDLRAGRIGRLGAPSHLKRYVLTEDGGEY